MKPTDRITLCLAIGLLLLAASPLTQADGDDDDVNDRGTRAPELVLPDDHRGVDDLAYRSRRADIARAGEARRPGQPLPVIEYIDAEHEAWQTVTTELRRLHRDLACAAFRDGAAALDLPTGHVRRGTSSTIDSSASAAST